MKLLLPTRRSFVVASAPRLAATAQRLVGYKGTSPLYRHQPNGQLITFSNKPPLSPDSPTVLGSLSPQGLFQQNPHFLELLHSVFCNAYLDDPHVRDLACSIKAASADSYIHVLGTRSNTQVVNDRDPASIIFSFLASSSAGLPVPNTYERNPAMRIYTPLDGFLVFPHSLQQALDRGLHIARTIEEQS